MVIAFALPVRPLDPRARRCAQSLVKLDPRVQLRNPVMFVVEVGALARWSVRLPRRCATGRPRSTSRSRSGCGSPCCSPTSPKRWPRAGARRRPSSCAAPRPTRSPGGWSAGARSASRPTQLRRGDRVVAEAGDLIADRRRDRRGRGDGRRIGDHRRVGPRHPRGRRRPLFGHRRHPRALRPHRLRRRRQPGRVVPRPHDRPRRRRPAPEDPERDRALDPALRADDRLRRRGGDAGAVLASTPAPRPASWC